MKVFLRFALCIQNCPSFPFHLISISVPELTKYKTGGRPGHLAGRDFIIHCSPLSIILYSETYAEKTVQHFQKTTITQQCQHANKGMALHAVFKKGLGKDNRNQGPLRQQTITN